MQNNPKYDPEEAQLIVRHLTTGIFQPEYILLFGTLAGGTPHSDIPAYDLLLVVRDEPDYDWIEVNRYLRFKMPLRQRLIPTINPYIVTLAEAEACKTPFLYLAQKEGLVLYCRDTYDFKRPAPTYNFKAAACEAKRNFETFFGLGEQLLERIDHDFSVPANIRTAALFTAQATVSFYQALYYVFYGKEGECYDPATMHRRMGTLSAQLLLAADDERTENIFELANLGRWIPKATRDTDFSISEDIFYRLLERVDKIQRAIRNACEIRIERYQELSQ